MFAGITVKAVAIFFGLATTAFCIATIVLAVEKANLENDLQDALDKIEVLTGTTTTASPVTTPSSGTTPSVPTTPSGPTAPSEPTTPSGESTPSTPSTQSTTTPNTSTPSSPITQSSTTPSGPIFPTLPTGLPNPEEIEWRLPSEVRPIRYRLYLHPNLVTGECDGTVSIQFQLDSMTNLIVLHAKDLNVHSISILNMMARMRIAIEKYYTDESRELLIIELKEVLSLSKAYTLSASFDCNLNDLNGAYRSSYSTANGDKR